MRTCQKLILVFLFLFCAGDALAQTTDNEKLNFVKSRFFMDFVRQLHL